MKKMFIQDSLAVYKVFKARVQLIAIRTLGKDEEFNTRMEEILTG